MVGGLDNFVSREGGQQIKIRSDSLAVSMVKYSAADMENRTVIVVVEAPGLANFTGAIEV